MTSELLAFDIVLTDRVEVDGAPFLLYYSKSRTSTETRFHAVEDTDDEDRISIILHIEEDAEHDFAVTQGKSLTPELKELLIAEIRTKLANR